MIAKISSFCTGLLHGRIAKMSLMSNPIRLRNCLRRLNGALKITQSLCFDLTFAVKGVATCTADWVRDSRLKSGRLFHLTALVLILNWVFVTAGPKLPFVESFVGGKYVRARAAFSMLLQNGSHRGRSLGYGGQIPGTDMPSVAEDVPGFPDLMEVVVTNFIVKYGRDCDRAFLVADGKRVDRLPGDQIKLVDLRATVSSPTGSGQENILAIQDTKTGALFYYRSKDDGLYYPVHPTYEEVQATIKDGIEWKFNFWALGFTLVSILLAALCDRVSVQDNESHSG